MASVGLWMTMFGTACLTVFAYVQTYQVLAGWIRDHAPIETERPECEDSWPSNELLRAALPSLMWPAAALAGTVAFFCVAPIHWYG